MCVRYNSNPEVYKARKSLSEYLTIRRKATDIDDIAFLAGIELYMLENIEAFSIEVEELIAEYLDKQDSNSIDEAALVLALAGLLRTYYLEVGVYIQATYSEYYKAPKASNFESLLLPYLATRVNTVLPDVVSNLSGNVKVNTRQRATAIAFTELGILQSISERLTMDRLAAERPIKKYWVGVLDDRIRDGHFEAAQFYNPSNAIGYNELFLVGGEWLQYPRDTRGSAKNIINCRCYISYVTK